MIQSLRNPSLAAIGGCGVVFLTYSMTSLLWSGTTSQFSPVWLATLALSFLGGMFVKDLRWVWVVFYIFCFANLLAIGVTYASRGDIWLPYGLVGNPNYLGCMFALGFAGSLCYRAFWFAPFTLLGIYLTGSRGAMFAAGACCFIYFWKRFPVASLAMFVFGLIAIREASLASEFDRSISIMARLGIWQDTLNHMTLWGHGWDSYAVEYAKFPYWTNMTMVKAPHAYNDLLEVIFDLGVGAIPLYLLVILCLGHTGPRLIAYTFLLLGLTYFPFYIPIVAQLFALTLGSLARNTEAANGSLETDATALPQRSRYGMGTG